MTYGCDIDNNNHARGPDDAHILLERKRSRGNL